MLILKKLSKAYDAPVLTDFSYEFPDCGFFLIRGRSGVGKTTLLRIIAGLETADTGTIEPSSPAVSFVFQEARLLPFLTLRENVLLVKARRDEKEADRFIDRLGLKDAADKYPDALSGGMRLRAAIARSLYFGGDVYLWDEPTKELDAENRRIIAEIIRERSQKALFLVVSHDDSLAGGTEILLS